MALLRLSLASLCFVSGVVASSPAKDAKLVLGGLLDGFLGRRHHLGRCMQGTELALEDFESGVRKLEENSTLEELLGLQALAKGFSEVPKALKACKALEQDVQDISSALHQMHSPVEFAFHAGRNLILNHHNIFDEVQGAIADWRRKAFKDFGFQVGSALRKLIVGDAQVLFEQFVERNGAQYESEEERSSRFAAFVRNLEHLGNLRQVEAGSASYSHLSPFADLSPEEFQVRHGWRAQDWAPQAESMSETLEVASLPASIDWREKGAVNPVKDQKQCGSCWAFATVANIEGAAFLSSGKLVSLSEQELVDCDRDTGDQGCDGGLPSNAYKDMIKGKIGLGPESAYPYEARDGKCRASKGLEKVFIGSWLAISKDEDQIAAALVKYGPLAIGINAGPLQLYLGGVLNLPALLCSHKKLDHGVAIVGFGTEKFLRHLPYWTIRNSWGKRWGEDGYFRIVRGKGACGLNTMVTTATSVRMASAVGGDILVV